MLSKPRTIRRNPQRTTLPPVGRCVRQTKFYDQPATGGGVVLPNGLNSMWMGAPNIVIDAEGRLHYMPEVSSYNSHTTGMARAALPSARNRIWMDSQDLVMEAQRQFHGMQQAMFYDQRAMRTAGWWTF